MITRPFKHRDPLTPAQQAIVESYYPYVLSKAVYWADYYNIPYDDVCQFGCLGLIHAVLTGDPEHPRYAHYITRSIKIHIQGYSGRYRYVSIPYNSDPTLPDTLDYTPKYRDHTILPAIQAEIAALNDPRDQTIANLSLGLPLPDPDTDPEPASHAEIGRILGITRQAVNLRMQSILRRLRVRLRKRLANH
jgi:RNA polymerase sigma factor (sigma-70 family)